MFQKPDSKHLLKIVEKGKTESGELARKSFNWELYEKEYHEEISKERANNSTGKAARCTSKKAKRLPRHSNKEYQMLKLYHLEMSSQTER